ncbi:insecticidal delta-endotoxin Cry8Ea1 family protein [Bacillus cereus]
MKVANDKIDQITITENVEELNKLNRGVISIIAWVGKSIGKWILKEGLGALKDIVLGKKGDPMIEIMQAVEELINQRLTQLKKSELEAEYIGFINAIDRLQDAINLVKKYENDKTRKGIEELIKAKDVIKHQLSALDILFTQRLPQFEISGYEGISLPLFAPIATLHLTLLKDAILNGKEWGLDTDSIKYYQISFNKLVPEYTKRAIHLYSTERDRRNIEGKFIFKNAMKETLNLIYLWSLYQYEGINPTFSQSYWYAGGGLPGNNKSYENIYRIVNGPTNGFITEIGYFLTNRSLIGNDDYLHGIHPIYNNQNKYRQKTGLLGSPSNSGMARGGIRSWKKTAVISDLNKTKKWLVLIDNHVVINRGSTSFPPATGVNYENHFVRTFSYIPYNINQISQFSMGETLSLHDTPNKMVRGNVVLGFAPDNTKTFFEKAKHLIPKESSYTIPALQFYDIESANNAFLKEYLEQGTDGGLEIKGDKKDETCIHYRINLENISENQEYKTLLRFGGIGTIRAFIEFDENNRIQVGEIKTTNLYGWKDYFIEGPLPKHFKNKKEFSLVIDVGTSDVKFSQAILIPKNKFKVLIP